MNVKDRDLSIDAVKVVALLCIIISHSLPFYGDSSLPSFIDLNMASNNISHFVLSSLRYLGQQGNILFVICASWFLTEKNQVKLKKILDIVIDSFVFSIFFMLLFLLCGMKISAIEIVKQFFPILFENNWFIGCYLMLYIIHPALNLIINSISKYQYTLILIILAFFYCGINFIVGTAYYYTPIIGFIIIYLATGYLKKFIYEYNQEKKWIWGLMISVALMILLLVMTNLIGLSNTRFSNKMLRWSISTNPFLLVSGVCIFNILRKKKIGNTWTYVISSNTLIIYIVHENILIREYFKPRIWLGIYNVFGYNYIFIWVVLFAIIMLGISLGISLFYKKYLKKITLIFSDRIERTLRTITNKVILKTIVLIEKNK